MEPMRKGRVMLWCALMVLLSGMALALPGCRRGSQTHVGRTEPQLYIGRTTLMVRQPMPKGMTIKDLAQLAAGQEVKRRSANTLRQLGIGPDVLDTVAARPIPDSHILQIDLTSSAPEEAKAGADVVAAELVRYFRERTALVPMQVVDPAYVFPLQRR